jgi:dihydrofolate reductase
VFVLTHHARPALEMEGGTSFHFVTGGIHEALHRAREAAGSSGVRIGGGARTVRQYLEAGIVDELHLVITPVLLGSGERLLDGMPGIGQLYECVETQRGERAIHVQLRRRGLRAPGVGRSGDA